MPEPGWHSTIHRLRYSDNDANGHVNNAVYAAMFEAGRVELIDAAGLIDRNGTVGAAIVRLEVDFRREMSWPGDVEVLSAIESIGTKSFRVRQRLLSGGEVRAEGVSVLVLIDRQTRRSVALDEAVRARLAPWMLAAG